MEDNFNNLISQIKEEKLTSVEKAILKHKVMSFVNSNPVQIPKVKSSASTSLSHSLLYIFKLIALTLILIATANSISNTLNSSIKQDTGYIINMPTKTKPLETQNNTTVENPVLINPDTTKPIEETTKPIIPIDTKSIPDYSSINSKSSPADLTPAELIRLRKIQIDKMAPLTNTNQNTSPQTP